MGRQAYLTKLAFGRSAFEPSQTTSQTSEYVQLSSSQLEIPPEAQDANSNKYVQLYDERGNPINPRAHEHGRRLREAQNDVLASIGVIERRRRIADINNPLPGSYLDRIEELEEEDWTGNVFAFASALERKACTWWIGLLRDRVLTFRFDAIPFVQIAASEWRASGSSFIHSGLGSNLLAIYSIGSFEYASIFLQPVNRFLDAINASAKTRSFFRRLRPVMGFCFRLSLELFFYPLTYHSNLQRLGLAPARPVFPPLKAFIPFSAASPLTPYSIYHDASASVGGFIWATLTSPFVFTCIGRLYRHGIETRILRSLEHAIAHPDNPDIRSPADYRTGSKPSSPRLQKAMDMLTTFLGWNHSVLARRRAEKKAAERTTIEVGERRLTDLTPLELPLSQQDVSAPPAPQEDDTPTAPVASSSNVVPPHTPPSPTASQTSQPAENDPRIRITSREGVLHMEVHLPAQVLSEVVESAPSTPRHGDASLLDASGTTVPQNHHRVTMLSLEPSYLLALICTRQIVTMAAMPFVIHSLRLTASHFLAGRDAPNGLGRVVVPLSSPDRFTLSAVGVRASHFAICAGLEFAIDLCIWGSSYMVVVWMGPKVFDWGKL